MYNNSTYWEHKGVLLFRTRHLLWLEHKFNIDIDLGLIFNIYIFNIDIDLGLKPRKLTETNSEIVRNNVK